MRTIPKLPSTSPGLVLTSHLLTELQIRFQKELLTSRRLHTYLFLPPPLTKAVHPNLLTKILPNLQDLDLKASPSNIPLIYADQPPF